MNNFVPDFTENFGKFDVSYNPGAKLLNIDLRVKFTFPDMKEPKKGGPLEAVQKARSTKRSSSSTPPTSSAR